MEIEIRACCENDVDQLERLFPSAGVSQWHRERFDLQEMGGAGYLLALDEDLIVGHCLLFYPGIRQPVFREAVGKLVPEIVALGIALEYQGQGVGTQLVGECERFARNRGGSRIAICVAADNERAKKLYERLGYVDIGLPPENQPTSWNNADGSVSTHDEYVVCLVKTL